MSKRTSTSRRQFIKGAAGAAAAVVAGPTIIPATALGNAQAAAPSNRLVMGFIGIGKMGKGHLEGFCGRRDSQVVAVCDVDTVRRKAARETVDRIYKELERKGVTSCTEHVDYHEVLGNKDVDAVLIAAPDHWHTAISIEACKAKKDIYCEKPLTLTIGEAKTIIDAVRKHERVFQTGSQQRSDGPFRQACELIRNGRLGKIKEVYVGIGTTSKPCDLPAEEPDPGLNWDMWLGQAPKRPYHHILCQKGLPDSYPFNPGWRDYREYSGGHVTDWGAHHFDITQWALDMDQSGPVEIHPPEKEGALYGAKLIYRGSPVGDEIVVTHMEMDNGIRFIGEKGEIFVDRGKILSKPDNIAKEELSAGDKKLYRSPGHKEDWIKCIGTRERPIADVEIGARSVTVCHLANLAYWHGRKLKWDPKKWEFPGDEEANKWRSREQREPYKLPAIA